MPSVSFQKTTVKGFLDILFDTLQKRLCDGCKDFYAFLQQQKSPKKYQKE